MPPGDTNSTPVGYGPLVGLTPMQVIGANPTRQTLVFYNPGSGQVAICPVNPPLSGVAALTPTINGPGSVTLSQNGTAVFDTLVCTAAWQAVAALAGSPLTIYEA